MFIRSISRNASVWAVAGVFPCYMLPVILSLK